MARKKVLINPIIGERIKTLRKEKKISQTELAQKLNYETGNTVLYWENGRSSVPADILGGLSDIFEVSIDYLLGRTSCRTDWKKYDEEHQEQLSSMQKNNQFEDYLKSIGFMINTESEVTEWHYEDLYDEDGNKNYKSQVADTESGKYTIFNYDMKATYNEVEFQSFISSINKLIEFEIFKQAKLN